MAAERMAPIFIVEDEAILRGAAAEPRRLEGRVGAFSAEMVAALERVHVEPVQIRAAHDGAVVAGPARAVARVDPLPDVAAHVEEAGGRALAGRHDPRRVNSPRAAGAGVERVAVRVDDGVVVR